MNSPSRLQDRVGVREPARMSSPVAPAVPTRRSLCASLASLGAATALASGASAAPATPPGLVWKTAIGLNGFESAAKKYKKEVVLWEVLDFAARNGFEGVELVANWPMGPYPASTEADRIRALRRLYDGFGLRIFSLQLHVSDAFAPDAPARKAWLQQFRDRARLARQLGCAHVGMWPGGGLRGQTIDQAVDNLGASFQEAGKIAGDLGLVAAFEIEPPFVFNTEALLERILAIAGGPALKTIYDPSHFDLMSGSKGKPHEMLERIGVDNIGYVHFTDTDGTRLDGGTSKHLPCGDGHVDVPASLARLRNGGFRGWIMIDEYEVPDPWDACVKCKRAIDKAGAAG